MTWLDRLRQWGVVRDQPPSVRTAPTREEVWSALIDDRRRTIQHIGEGAWDVADVMGVLERLGVFQ